MSLPREPRQKMINMMYLVLTALLALNVSSEILNAFKTINKSMENTNTTVGKSTDAIMTSLEQKAKDSASAEKARTWLGKAKVAQSETKSLFDFIQGLKEEILEAAGGNKNDPNQKFKEDNLDIATRIMVEKGKGKDLLKRLSEFKNKLLKGIDPKIDSAFGTSLPIDLDIPKSSSKAAKTWEGAYFHMVPTVAALTMLTKFQNDVKTSENRVIAFCHEQVGKVEVVFDTYNAIIGQSSNYLMPGQELEITAGVGAFSKKALPEITIGGQRVAVGEDGAARTKLAGGGVGSRSVPVRIVYTDQDGKKQTIEKNIEYTVGQANASIALDKMNVLYIGVKNPITIAASGGGDDRVAVSIAGGGGRVEKVGGGKYNVYVTQQSDDTKITVSVDGKVAGISSFRVRQIPGSVATVGGFASGENIPAATFRAQGGVAAWIKDFPFDLKYTVTQFTISTDSDEGDYVEAIVQGNAFSGNATNLIKTHVKAGKTVYIDNIRAVGEDGQNKKVPSLVYYIK